MAFHFPLATVLRVRSIIEEREEALLRRILCEIDKTIEVVSRINAEIANVDTSRRSDILKVFLGINVRASYNEVELLNLNKRNLDIKLERLEQLRDKQLVAYRTARRNREMLTDMHAEKRRIYDLRVTECEQKSIDDNYIARRGRN